MTDINQRNSEIFKQVIKELQEKNFELSKQIKIINDNLGSVVSKMAFLENKLNLVLVNSIGSGATVK